jgi:hypothetical protein
MDVMLALPWTITVAWVVVLAWAVGQFVWLQYLRVRPTPQPPRRRIASEKRPAPPKAVVTTLPTGGTPEFLAELGLNNATERPPAPTDSVYR